MTRRKAQKLASEGLAEPEELHVFFKRLNERRTELGLSQVNFGALIGISGQMAYQLENGALPRDPARIAAIAKALGVSLDWLFGLTD